MVSKTSKPRNHKGINLKTGKLNTGYKYSGKKLKSGMKQIIKIQNGGKVMGRGGFGCAIAPAISCGTKSSIFEKRVSKITYSPDMSEIVNGKKLKKIDPQGKYLIYIQEHCKITKEQLGKSNIKKCKLKEKNTYDNLVMKKGKGSLYTMRNQMSEKAQIKSLYETISGSQMLLKHNFAHLDLKAQNIVIARPRIGMGKYESYIIDFGGDYLVDGWESFKKNILTFGVPYHFPPEVQSVMPRYIRNALKNKQVFIVPKYQMLGPLKIYSKKLMKTKKGYKKYMDKVMSYLIGNAFNRNFITEKMTDKDPNIRITLKEAKKLIEKTYPYVKESVSFKLSTPVRKQKKKTLSSMSLKI